jgi:hypothetical protein
MGIHDRDWYWEHRDKVQRGGVVRGAPPPSPSRPPVVPEGPNWWTRGGAVVACCALVFLGVRNYQLRGDLREARELVQQQAQQIRALELAAAARPPSRVEFFRK